MKIHLIGGFLGSGKTTAITHAVGILSAKGLTAGIIANDQGKYLVDAEYLRSIGVPNGQVTGGCFCCNYDSLVAEIDRLEIEYRPQVVFAESVGSCTDLVATVLKPLEKFKVSVVDITFSILVDSRLLRDYLNDRRLPFNDDTNYIWKKQIEESEILIVNKIDQLDAAELKSVEEKAPEMFPGKSLLFQNSLDEKSVGDWLDILERQPTRERKSLEIDYDRYASGEANLAWLDEAIDIYAHDGKAPFIAREFVNALVQSARSRGMAVGHLKFLLESAGQSEKISLTSLNNHAEPLVNLAGESNHAHLVVNARIESSPDLLRRLVAGLLNELRVRFNVEITESNISFFRPSYPRPTHRVA